MTPSRDPLKFFHEWFEAARHLGFPEPDAATLATVDPQGKPSIRTVLIRGVDERGFAFYTNLGSRKGLDLLSRPAGAPASILFYWPPAARQVRIEGRVDPVDPREADAYWATRPRGHQVAAYASPQSRELPGGREELERLFAEWDQKLPRENVPRPAFWSGFRLVPDSIEFWQGRENRLHERTLYKRKGEQWIVSTLAP